MDHARTQSDCEISKNVSNFSVFFQVAKIIQLLIQLTANSISKKFKLKKKQFFKIPVLKTRSKFEQLFGSYIIWQVYEINIIHHERWTFLQQFTV